MPWWCGNGSEREADEVSAVPRLQVESVSPRCANSPQMLAIIRVLQLPPREPCRGVQMCGGGGFLQVNHWRRGDARALEVAVMRLASLQNVIVYLEEVCELGGAIWDVAPALL